MAHLAMPKRPRGRPSAAVQAEYAAALAAWCDGIKEIASLGAETFFDQPSMSSLAHPNIGCIKRAP